MGLPWSKTLIVKSAGGFSSSSSSYSDAESIGLFELSSFTEAMLL